LDWNAAMETSLPVAERPRRPEWMKVRAPSKDGRYFDVQKLVHGLSLHTICEEARCPNIAECWGRGTATFQILGDTCTRACRYCYVHSGKPEHPPDPLEPLRLAKAAAEMNLKHVVVTSVDRDDVPDRGAGHYAATIRALREHGVDVVTIGQYLQPSAKHAKIDRWVHPDEFRWFRKQGEALGFGSVFSGPLVRSSYRADEQRHAAETGRGAVAY